MNWQEKGNQLTKEFELDNFRSALAFVNRVGELAEAANHHPDIHLVDYKKVIVQLTTHEVGGVTQKDHYLASKIDKLPLIAGFKKGII